MQTQLNTSNCLNGSISGCPYKSLIKICKRNEKCFHTQFPYSTDPTQFQWSHREIYGKHAWQDLSSNSFWSAKAFHEAAEANSSMRIIHPELPQAPPAQPPVGGSSKRLKSQQTREKKNDSTYLSPNWPLRNFKGLVKQTLGNYQ